MIKTLILIPEHDNDGTPFEAGTFREFEAQLRQIEGGFSMRAGIVGEWQGFRDANREYTVAIESWLDLGAWLSVAVAAIELFRQQAIYIEVAGVPEVISRAGSLG
ncbi:MAG: hypothetical protein WD557_04215 [Dehalococcoidia bacterium]